MSVRAALEAIEAGRKLITLVAVLLTAAGLYVWGETGHRDARSLATWGDTVCAFADTDFRAVGQKKREWGVACTASVQRLSQIERDLQAGSLEALLADLERRDGKNAADAALAAALSKRAADAAERMEQADAAVEGDRVDGNWACAANGVGGLRAPGC